MQQHFYEDQFRGKRRKLVIFRPEYGNEYRVFCDGGFIGSINSCVEEGTSIIWKSDYSILKPIALHIGKSIEADLQSTS
jgi:hypothetical protein